MENLTGGNPPVRPLPCVVPCKLYFLATKSSNGFLAYFQFLYQELIIYTRTCHRYVTVT